MYPGCCCMQVDLSFNPNAQLKLEVTSGSGIARWLDGKGGDRGLPPPVSGGVACLPAHVPASQEGYLL